MKHVDYNIIYYCDKYVNKTYKVSIYNSIDERGQSERVERQTEREREIQYVH